MVARLWVMVAGLVLAGSAVHAAPRKHAKHDADDAARRADDDDDEAPRRVALKARERDRDFVTVTDDDEANDEPATIAAIVPPPARPAWHASVGPYVWIPDVGANVSVGGKSVGTGRDLFPIERHPKYGIELLGEAHHGKWVMSGDLMFGVVGLSGGTSVGPVTASLTGEASATLLDAQIGYAVIGDDHAPFALEARGGVRYQHTTVSGGIGIAGVSAPILDTTVAGGDVVLGARGVLRPWPWLALSGLLDYGVYGASSATWSAILDAGVRVSARVQLSVGYRTLTIQNTQVDLTLHGPRAAVQLVF